MSGTRRTPIRRQHEPQINEAAVRLFIAMQRLRCTCDPNNRFYECPGCKQWRDLEHRLSREIGAKIWEYSCIENPRTGNPEPLGTYNHARWQPDEKGRERWRALEQGAKELRRRERAIRRAKAEQKRNAQLDVTIDPTGPSANPAPHAASEQSDAGSATPPRRAWSIDPNDAAAAQCDPFLLTDSKT
jgi:hypothetical protein